VPHLAMSSGVSYYYTALLSYLDAQKVDFEVGGAPRETARWRKLRRLHLNHWRLHRRLSTKRFDLVYLNPSIDPPSVFRRGALILIAGLHRRSALVFYRGCLFCRPPTFVGRLLSRIAGGDHPCVA
jgi:hypothetical protein